MTGLSIIIVNWNTGNQLRECLKSIQQTSHAGFQLSKIVIVDNDSHDASMEGCDGFGLPVSIIRNTENKGFGAACNQGAVGATGDYLLFLNPDTRVFETSLAVPIHHMELPENQNIGICGVQMVDEDGNVHATCSPFPNLTEFVAKAVGLDFITSGRIGGRFQTDIEPGWSGPVDQVMGAFFLVRTSLFNELKGFDERFFVYFEEVDFSKRAAFHGYSSHFTSQTSIFHKGGGSSSQALGKRLFYNLRSRILYGFKHFSLLYAVLLLLITAILEPITRLLYAAVRASKKDIMGVFEGYMHFYKWLITHRTSAGGKLS